MSSNTEITCRMSGCITDLSALRDWMGAASAVFASPFMYLSRDGDAFDWMTCEDSEVTAALQIQEQRLSMNMAGGVSVYLPSYGGPIWVTIDPSSSTIRFSCGANLPHSSRIPRAIKFELMEWCVFCLMQNAAVKVHSVTIDLLDL